MSPQPECSIGEIFRWVAGLAWTLDLLLENGMRRGNREDMVSPARLEEHRTALTGHCCRMLGSVVEADDAVQETMLRAWRSLERFEGRASLRTWLYRIATNVCFDTLAERARRERPIETSPPPTVSDALPERPRTRWLEADPDARALSSDVDPAELAALRESIRLAFLAALQHLPPKQRAVLLLTEVLGWSAAEIADRLGTSVAAVHSALQRARTTLATKDLGATTDALTDGQSWLLERYVEAFERYDVDALTELLHEDATLSMPGYALCPAAREPIHSRLLGPASARRESRLVATTANG